MGEITRITKASFGTEGFARVGQVNLQSSSIVALQIGFGHNTKVLRLVGGWLVYDFELAFSRLGRLVWDLGPNGPIRKGTNHDALIMLASVDVGAQKTSLSLSLGIKHLSIS